MEHGRIDDDQIAERYLIGTLADPERQPFEDHFADCPQCLDRLEAVQGLRAGLQALRSDEHRVAAGVSRHPPFRGWWLAAACLLLGVASSLFLSTRLRQAREELAFARQSSERAQRRQAELSQALERERSARTRLSAAAGALRAAPVFMLDLTRATSPEPANRVVLAASADWVTLVFDRPEARGVEGYRVRVSTAGGAAVAEADPARASTGFLSVSLPSDRLPAGDYTLVVEGIASGRPLPLSEYRFRASRP